MAEREITFLDNLLLSGLNKDSPHPLVYLLLFTLAMSHIVLVRSNPRKKMPLHLQMHAVAPACYQALNHKHNPTVILYIVCVINGGIVVGMFVILIDDS